MSVEEIVMQFLRQEGGPFSPKEVADALGIKRETAKRTLFRLYKKRKVARPGKGMYRASGTSLAYKIAKSGTKKCLSGTTLAYNVGDKHAKKGQKIVIKTVSFRSGVYNYVTLIKRRTGKSIGEVIDEALIEHYGLPIYKKWGET